MMHFGILRFLSLLLAIAAAPSALALFKLLPESGNLVENAKEDLVYLFQFPRTALTPSQAALNLKVETWLKWANIPFHRVSNQFFLGSRSAGIAPFALYNGVFYDGSDAIIEKLGAKLGKYQPNAEEKELREDIDDKLFKFLMVDRASRNATGTGGLDWMFKDEGIVQQMVPLLLNLTTRKLNLTLAGGAHYQFEVNSSSLNAYFNAYIHEEDKMYDDTGLCWPESCPQTSAQTDAKAWNDCVQFSKECLKQKQSFLREHLTQSNGEAAAADRHFTLADWLRFSAQIRATVIQPALRGILTAGPASSEARLNQLLAANTYVGRKCTEFKYSTFKGSGDEVLDELLYILRPIVRKLRDPTAPEEAKFSADSSELTPANASLFGALIQYFETPLNNEALRKHFQPNKNAEPMEVEEADVKVLRDFVRRVKKSLGLTLNWDELRKRPWKLNYEDKGAPEENGNILAKFNGPYSVDQVDQLEQIHEVLNADGSINDSVLAKYPAVVQTVVPKILVGYVDNFWSKKMPKQLVEEEDKTHKLKKMMLQAMAAYICNGESQGNNGKTVSCAEKHFENIRQSKEHDYYEKYIWNYVPQSRGYTYDAIIEHNEALIKQNVLRAIDAARAANAVSDVKIGNEQ